MPAYGHKNQTKAVGIGFVHFKIMKEKNLAKLII